MRGTAALFGNDQTVQVVLPAAVGSVTDTVVDGVRTTAVTATQGKYPMPNEMMALSKYGTKAKQHNNRLVDFGEETSFQDESSLFSNLEVVNGALLTVPETGSGGSLARSKNDSPPFGLTFSADNLVFSAPVPPVNDWTELEPDVNVAQSYMSVQTAKEFDENSSFVPHSKLIIGQEKYYEGAWNEKVNLKYKSQIIRQGEEEIFMFDALFNLFGLWQNEDEQNEDERCLVIGAQPFNETNEDGDGWTINGLGSCVRQSIYWRPFFDGRSGTDPTTGACF